MRQMEIWEPIMVSALLPNVPKQITPWKANLFTPDFFAVEFPFGEQLLRS